MKQKLKKYYGFTVIELLMVTVILGLIVPSIITIYTFMVRSNKEFNFRQMSIQQGYEFFEKLNILMQDYTIDYEEYYNRQMVGCVNSGGLLTGGNFKWNIGISGYCTEFTAYGNENSTQRKMGKTVSSRINTEYHDIYNCSSIEAVGVDQWGLPRTVGSSSCGKYGSKQSFGQYKSLFIDVKGVGTDADDKDLGKLVNDTMGGAVADPNNIQELYLISHDGKNRLYFRRKLAAQSSGSAQYKIQMLRLRGFDAGQKHNFASSNNEGLYDGQIDTWACDTSMGFVGSGASIGGAYSGYYLPKDADDCWINLTQGSTSVYTWNLSISPLNDPDLYWAEQSHQINPYMKILLVNGVYLPTANSDDSVNSFKIPIETTINMKDFYKE